MKQGKVKWILALLAAVIVIILAVVLFGSKIPAYENAERTYANLITALEGENTAKQKYINFAAAAAKEGNTVIEKLFTATADAEDIHIRKEYDLANRLKPLDMPSAEDYPVVDSAGNLQSCVDGEMYEADTMYPQFFTEAEEEGFRKARKIFAFARDAERSHGELFSKLLTELEALGEDEKLDYEVNFYMCPVCGRLEMGKGPLYCSVCFTPGFMFQKY